jgi:hypothetical protein
VSVVRLAEAKKKALKSTGFWDVLKRGSRSFGRENLATDI